MFNGLCAILAMWWGWLGVCEGAGTLAPKANKARPVWVVFFGAQDCDHCTGVKKLLAALKTKYPVRTKAFDVEREADYALLRRLEAIHSQEKFAVPLVIVGESILIGESEIMGKLEKAVRSLSHSGGAALPYLGREEPVTAHRDKRPVNAKKQVPVAESARPSDGPYAEEGRPPTLGEEWKKIRALLDKYF